MEVLQIHLSSGSKRLVRFRVLSPRDRDAALKRAGLVIGKEGTVLDLKVATVRESLKDMLVQVSRKAYAEPPASPVDPDVEWDTLSAEKLEMPGPLHYDTLFSAKDDEILTGLYRRFHEVSAADVEAIAGKALTVSLG